MFKVRSSHAILVAAMLTTLVSLAACNGPPASPPQFTLRMGVFSVQDYLPYFVMQEQGFAKENGLQFEDKSYPGGAAVIEAIAADSLDVGSSVGSVVVLSAAERGLIPGKVVPVAANNFADPEHPGVAILAARSVNSWKDLQGQQIGINAIKSITGAATKGRLHREGVRNHTFVEIPFANMGLAVAGGNVAAAGMSEPFLTQSLLRGDGKLLSWVIGGPPFERMEFTLIVFRGDFYRKNAEAVKAFLRAHLQAVRWMSQNPDGARSILARRLGLRPEVGQKMNLLRWPLDARNDPALLESMQPLLIEIGLLKARIPARRLYDETLLDEVLAEKR